MRETLRFQPNVPEVVALAFAEGREVEGRFGNQVMFTLEDDRVMYLDPPVAEKLKELGIRKGQEFQVVKREIVDGKRRSFEWKIEAVKLAAAAPPAAKREKAAAQPETPERVQAQSTAKGVAKPTNGNGAHVPVPFTGTGAGDFLLSALVNSVDIWLATQQYARAKGLELVVTSEDVRALAITAFINTRGGH
jgi:hypothetical protein